MKRFIIFVLIVVVLGGGVFVYWFFTQSMDSPRENNRNVFPEATNTLSDQENFEAAGTPPLETTGVLFSQIVDAPVAGFALIENNEQPAPIDFLRYVEKGTGHIWDVSLTTRERYQISNETIQNVVTAEINQTTGDVAIVYSNNQQNNLRTVITQINQQGTSTPNYTINDRFFLPVDIVSLAPLNTGWVYAVQQELGGETLVMYNGRTRDESRSLSVVPLHDIELSGAFEEEIVISTKPSSFSRGYVFDENMTLILEPRRALSVLSARDSLDRLFSSINESNNIELRHTRDNREEWVIGPTFSEKCVWSRDERGVAYCSFPQLFPRGTYPDDWFKGKVSFNDSLFRINTTTQERRLVGNLGEIDVSKLSINSRSSALVLQNKKDSSLWSLDLDLFTENETPPSEDIF